MNRDCNIFSNGNFECGIDDGVNADSASTDIVSTGSPVSLANWAWAQRGDSFDWMDWHGPFAAFSWHD